jgi:tripartite-type tricarboxylate transporter receptor subunit TctC
MIAALDDSSTRNALIELGVDVQGDTPEQFAAYIKAEIPKWTALVKASGASVSQ